MELDKYMMIRKWGLLLSLFWFAVCAIGLLTLPAFRGVCWIGSLSTLGLLLAFTVWEIVDQLED